jgi:hypothetical protein
MSAGVCDPQLVTVLEVGNDHAIVRLGTGYGPSYRHKMNNASQKSKMIAHHKIDMPVHDTSSTSR